MSAGVNCDPLNPGGSPEPIVLQAAGFRWVRLVSRPGCEDYVLRCHAAGLMAMAVVARESAGFMMGGIADIYQIGNEPDATGPSSWTLSPMQYREEWHTYRGTYPDLTMIAAGLASGITAWWKEVRDQGGLQGCSGYGVHPYNKTATAAQTLLGTYRNLTPTLPIWVTEWYRPQHELSGFAGMLQRQSGIAGHAFFCASDAMVQGFGLTERMTRMLTAA